MTRKKKQIPEHQQKRIEEINLFIQHWRMGENLSQREYSKRANIHVNTLQRFQTHNSNISIQTLFALIDALDDMTLSEFFSGMI
jgi:transcriptional regulator with XRE-family HTH domain